MNNKNYDLDKIMQAAQRSGIDKISLEKAKAGDTEALLNKLSESDRKNILNALNNREQLKKILSGKKAQGILNNFLGGEKRMDDLSSKLEGILNDPESMEKVRQMAEGLLGAQSDEPKEYDKSGPDPQYIKKLMPVFSKLNSKSDDKRIALLMALKPNLSEERRNKVDAAVKLIKLIEMLPYLKECGLLDF